MNQDKLEKLSLSLFKQITSNEGHRGYIYSGVHHDEQSKKAVVTDGRFLFATPLLYSDELKGLTISTYSYKPLDGKFPDYSKVVPDTSQYDYHFDSFELPKIKPAGNRPVYVYISDKGVITFKKQTDTIVCCALNYLVLLLAFQNGGIEFKLHFHDNTKPIVFEIEGIENIFILMPVKM